MHYKNNVEEYSRMCNDMELEINALLSPGSPEKNPEGNFGHVTILILLAETMPNMTVLT